MSQKPTVIGGVGGSGTRVVAEILSKAKIYLGSDLSKALDNYWFTFLFKRPNWYSNTTALEKEKLISFFIRLMRNGLENNFSEVKILLRTLKDWYIKEGPKVKYSFSFFMKCIFKMMKHDGYDKSKYSNFGWKEPNTHIYLEPLVDCSQDIKYIHVMRNGLDMAFSGNQQQLYNWGNLFGVSKPKSESQVPAQSLKFWIKSNQRSIGILKEKLTSNHLIVKHEDLCLEPEKEIKKILGFIGIELEKENKKRLYSIPRVPDSMNRHKDHDLNFLNDDLVEEVEKLGYTL